MSLPARQNKIEKITDEVKVLHPMLDQLLRKMPEVKDVEYTQGNRERGADFVLLKTDVTTSMDDHVGVIVKIGPLHQNFTDIERQIDECTLERTFRNGKDKIRIREIWIFVTGVVTGGAQEKIWEKFKTSKIVFFDGRRVEELIDKYVPYVWMTGKIHTAKYLSDLNFFATEADKRYSLIPSLEGDLFIEPDVCTFPRKEYRIRLQRLAQGIRKVDFYSTIDKERILLLEADMGMGKTKLLRHLVKKYTTPGTFEHLHYLPIPLTFKEIVDDYDLNIDAAIEDKLPQGVRDELEDSTKILLLIDGLDEKKGLFSDQMHRFEALVENIAKRESIKAIFASRRLKAFEECVAIRNHVGKYFIRSLSFKKALIIIAKICNNLDVTNRIAQGLRKSPLFDDLPKNPIAIILLASLLNESDRDVPSNLTELYEKYTEYALGRWDMEKGLQSQKEFSALSQIMMNISQFMLDNEVQELDVDHAKSFFNEYLDRRTLGIKTDDLFNMMMTRTEIMAFDYTGTRILFKHRTFPEFFYAKHAAHDRNLAISNRAFQMYWQNTYFFYLGLLQDAPEILLDLLGIEPDTELEKWLKLINMSNFFLAAYLSPKDVARDLVKQIMKEASSFYLRIVSGKSSGALARMPRMHVLWLFQTVIRGAYSYDLFKDALEEAAIDIGSEANSPEKLYSLFFIAATLTDITRRSDYDFLLTESGGNLPADLSFAFYHEVKDAKQKSKLMKKAEKRVRKLFLGNTFETKRIKELYENPIKVLGQ
ncbi:MAG: NACHT domain-containing protein [Acidobacteria bacterium]|nr:NACHT domain-containing protein [Acidobacteriota bacterium]